MQEASLLGLGKGLDLSILHISEKETCPVEQMVDELTAVVCLTTYLIFFGISDMGHLDTKFPHVTVFKRNLKVDIFQWLERFLTSASASPLSSTI